jgi:DNA-binding response OmpR family regulator
VRLIFPIAPTGLTVRESSCAPSLPPLRILLVDDDPLVLKSLRDALENDGHEVVTAEGGLAGIDEFSPGAGYGKRFDIVITDLGMPYVDGRKVRRARGSSMPRFPSSC